jgi:hypothetical protein
MPWKLNPVEAAGSGAGRFSWVSMRIEQFRRDDWK